MTIKELKQQLDRLPEDAEAFFTLYTEDGARNYWFNPTGGKKVYDGNNGQFAQIAYCNDCPAHRLIDVRNKMLFVGEKI